LGNQIFEKVRNYTCPLNDMRTAPIALNSNDVLARWYT
jgi:hypothetical protein